LSEPNRIVLYANFYSVFFCLTDKNHKFGGTAGAYQYLSNMTTIINDIPGTKVQVIGYTDSTGAADYNMKLSQLRANSVAIRLHELGKEVENPVASNKTEDGRKKNRRVEIKLSAQNSL
jgi:outer membrane protein OmpA-like peptidoglycan-associated protein